MSRTRRREHTLAVCTNIEKSNQWPVCQGGLTWTSIPSIPFDVSGTAPVIPVSDRAGVRGEQEYDLGKWAAATRRESNAQISNGDR